MGILTSGQLAVKPFRVATSASLKEIANAAASRRYPLSTDQASSGWGSIDDDDGPINLPVSIGLSAGRSQVESGFEAGPDRRLRLRFYWAALDTRAQKARGVHAGWQVLNYLNAVDFVLYEEREGSYTGLVTMRTPAAFNHVIEALRELLLTIDDTPQIVTDTIPEVLSEDFFLWLVDQDERDEDIAEGFALAYINEISSKDRQYRSARFKDTANAERIELAALIARGKVGFGPAKVQITSELHEATFDVEFHLDGGFQALRSSEYDEIEYSTDALGVALVDDIWTSVLPALRNAYNTDGEWQDSRRSALRESAIDAICSQLGLVRA